MVSMSMLGKNSKQVIVLWNQRTNEMTLALGMLRTRMQKVPSGDPDNDFQKKKKKNGHQCFYRGPYGPPLRSNWTLWVLLLVGVPCKN